MLARVYRIHIRQPNMSSSMIEREIAAAERALREATEEYLHRESTDEGSYGTSAQNSLPLESRIQSFAIANARFAVRTQHGGILHETATTERLC
jgi:hypothetical protein